MTLSPAEAAVRTPPKKGPHVMSTYHLDATAQQLRATGITEPIMQWIEDGTTGRRRPSDVQDVNENGVPLWAIEVQYVAEAWGRLSTVVAKVTMPSPEAPQLAAFEVVPFVGLSVTVTPTKAGGMREAWRAEGIATSTRRAREEAAAA